MYTLFAIYYPVHRYDEIIVGSLLALLAFTMLVKSRSSPSRMWRLLAGWVACFCALAIFVALLFPPVARVPLASDQTCAKNNLRQLVIAMHAYVDTHEKKLPPAAIRDKDGRPLLSWRVLLLPYLEHEDLYRKFRLDEPWDSPHNAALLPEMPDFFVCGKAKGKSDKTYFQVFVGKGTAFDGDVSLRACHRGGTATVLIVEAGEAVPWTKPDDLVYDADKPLPALGGVWKSQIQGWHAGMSDATVRVFSADESEATIRKAIVRGDGG